jgi:hypothetical protein
MIGMIPGMDGALIAWLGVAHLTGRENLCV